MLFLVFNVGRDRYAIEAAQVIAIVPLVQVKQIPLAPPGVAGAFDYHGTPVPAIDLCQLMLGRPSRRRLSTRIVLVHYSDAHGGTHLLGLIAEQVTRTLQREPVDFVSSGVESDGAAYLGPVVNDGHGLVQWIEVPRLLPEAVRDVLFRRVPAEREGPVVAGTVVA